MDSRKYVMKQTGTVALGVLLAGAAMVGVFALLGYYDRTVLLGALAGSLVAVLNFFFMAVGLTLAADKAQEQEVKKGKAMVTSSYFLWMIVMFVVLFACAKSGYCNAIALVLPLLFVRPVLTVAEFFQKKGSDA
jgi:uncharacterized membrane-anchored protein